MDRQAIGKKIKILLRARGISQNDLAEAIGVNKGTMSRWITGERQMTVYALKRCADYFGTTMDFIAEGIGEKHGVYEDT